jgi:hypothetical protein
MTAAHANTVLAATNKCLARSNKSGGRAPATKRRVPVPRPNTESEMSERLHLLDDLESADVQPIDWQTVRNLERNAAKAKGDLAAAAALLEQFKTTGADNGEIVGTRLRKIIAARALCEAETALDGIFNGRQRLRGAFRPTE